MQFMSGRDLDQGFEAFYHLYVNDQKMCSLGDFTHLIGLVEKENHMHAGATPL